MDLRAGANSFCEWKDKVLVQAGDRTTIVRVIRRIYSPESSDGSSQVPGNF